MRAARVGVTVDIAIGVDLVEIDRVARVLTRHPIRFLDRYFTAAERAQCGRDAARVAGRWAAKEAAVKALGTGFGPVGWRDVEIVCDATGAPALRLHGAAAEHAAARGLVSWSVSLSHGATQAVAVVAGAGWNFM